jgi:hypothetical protein
MEDMVDRTDYIWRAIAKKDCQQAVETIYETVVAFPELMDSSDSLEKLQEHLGEVCELLYLDEPWEETDGS